MNSLSAFALNCSLKSSAKVSRTDQIFEINPAHLTLRLADEPYRA
jgi:hypothetical protein